MITYSPLLSLIILFSQHQCNSLYTLSIL
uniref:Uncharacterized protein n=1 Tax=Anguilla anguilla TaxID=7936 RepID=A0A0E9PV68_ANGAN